MDIVRMKIDDQIQYVSIIIITLNEEENILQCLENIEGWTDDIHIVDSGSNDNTVEIAKKFTKNISIIEKGHWANIRNWAMENLPLKNEWVLFLDADEFLSTELKQEIITEINSQKDFDGFYIKRRFIFMNKWLKYGGLYPKVLRLFKFKKVKYIESGDVEYAKINGHVGELKYDMIHKDLKPFSRWVDKHNRISDRAALRYIELKNGKIEELYKINKNEVIEGNKVHIIREKIFDKLPLFLTPFALFFYAYILRLGFLDGIYGFIYHSHQSFWYRLLIYTKVREMSILKK